MAFTEQKRRYADARLSGLTKKESAIEAGCPQKTASQAACRYEKDPEVIAAMSRTLVLQEKKATPPETDPDPYIPASSDDPMAFLKSMMNDLEADPKMRLDAAKALMPYVHGRIAEAGKKDAKANAAKVAGKGKFSAGTAPKLVVNNR